MRDEALLFRRRLAARVLGLVSAASLAGCGGSAPEGAGTTAGSTGTGGATGTGGDAGARAGTGTGGVVGAGGAAGTGGSASGGGSSVDAGPGNAPTGPAVRQCFDWAADAGPCPYDGATIIAQLTHGTCPSTGWDPYKIDSGPSRNGAGQCCYLVELELCAAGGRPYLVGGGAAPGERPLMAAAVRGAGSRGWS